MTRAEPAAGYPGLLRSLRHLLWGVAVVCLGIWGWARLDAARFEAAAEERLQRAISTASSPAGIEASALERAVERDLRGRRRTGRAPGERLSGALVAAAEGIDRDQASTATVVDSTEVLGRLRIPRLGLSAMIAEGVDRRTLRRAAGRVPGTAPLGTDGNVAIAGHRDGVFRELARAAAGDLVLVETPGGTDRYRIEAVSIVGAEATGVLAATERPTLTLITCHPFDLLGPAPDRWVVRARRVDPASS